MTKSTKGGYRPGAGRKKVLPPDAKPRPIKTTEFEFERLKEYLQSLRSESDMKKISELVTITGGSILENSSTIVEAIITTNGWDKTFIPAVLEMSNELKVSVINTYEFMVHENIPKHTIRRALDGIVIPHIPQK